MRKFKQRFPVFFFLLITTLIYSILLLTPNYRHYPIFGFQDLVFVLAHWGLSAFGLFAIFTLLSMNRYIYAILFPIFSIVSAITAYFIWQIDISINSALVESIFLTNMNEALSYASGSLVLFILITTVLTVFMVIWRFKLRWKKQEVYLVFVAGVISAAFFFFTDNIRKNTLTARAPFSYYIAAKDLFNDKKEINAERFMLGDNAISMEDSIITVFIIGESLRADHLQMNGYHRRTMPNMEERGVISLPNVYSPFTYTASSISYILTRADEENRDPMVNESSFVDIFKSCGFHSAWLANQNPIFPFRFFINETDTIYINKPQFSDYSNTAKYDSDLIAPFQNIVNQPNPKKLIILHLAGNHWWYNKNLPDEFIHFKPILENKTLSQSNRERMINSYDNVTLFTDSVINEFMKAVEDKKVLLIFLSDHGESFGENGKWLHANDMPVEQNPASFIWFSDKYRRDHPEKVQILLKSSKKNVDTAFLFHTIIAGSHIQSPYIDNSYNLFYDSDK